ncbi:MAG: cation diffusion facilitator family transporter [bacterium]
MEHAPKRSKDRAQLEFAMRLSLGFGALMLAIKITAYFFTDSAAILSDAAESIVHIVAVGFAAYSLKVSFKPADANHLFGHAKISFFSSGFEGAMIVIAALYILYAAISKWLAGLVLEHLDLGSGLTALAVVINGALGAYLLRVGKRTNSVILEANGKHVLTDCWTSIGVLVGLALIMLTGWLPWDPIVAIIVALNILYSGFGLMARSFGGLMDKAERSVSNKLIEILNRETQKSGIMYHGLRHRNLGNSYAVEFHLLFPGDISIRQAHRDATRIEQVVEESFNPRAYVISHLEAIEDHSESHAHKPH